MRKKSEGFIHIENTTKKKDLLTKCHSRHLCSAAWITKNGINIINIKFLVFMIFL